MRLGLAAAAFAALTLALGSMSASETQTRILTFASLQGWAEDDHDSALATFRATCRRIGAEAWKPVCADAAKAKAGRAFFETHFVPVEIRDSRKPLFTGYYEPELTGSRTRTDTFRFPLYRVPPDVVPGQPWLTRREIEETGALAGRGLELAWLADPVETFFLHVQGSGRLILPDGSPMRVGFAGRNGHTYRSVGREMARRGLLGEHRVSAAAIKAWVRRNPRQGREVLWHNPSFIFFREVDLPPEAGPVGAMSTPLTRMRSIAVDPDFTPLGAPVWIEKSGKEPLHRLMIAQDTGSAIKGAQRADIFYGSGKAAGDRAGKIRDGGRMVVLLPKGLAKDS